MLKDVEIIGVLKSWVKKALEAATISTVSVTQSISDGTELADIDVSGTSTKVYMPTVSLNGQEQDVSGNELDLEVADHVITPTQWSEITTIFS